MKPNQSMSTTVRPAKFILRPAKFLMKPAIEEPRTRLCSSEEVEAKKQAVGTRKRKQSEKEALEIDERNKEKWRK